MARESNTPNPSLFQRIGDMLRFARQRRLKNFKPAIQALEDRQLLSTSPMTVEQMAGRRTEIQAALKVETIAVMPKVMATLQRNMITVRYENMAKGPYAFEMMDANDPNATNGSGLCEYVVIPIVNGGSGEVTKSTRTDLQSWYTDRNVQAGMYNRVTDEFLSKRTVMRLQKNGEILNFPADGMTLEIPSLATKTEKKLDPAERDRLTAELKDIDAFFVALASAPKTSEKAPKNIVPRMHAEIQGNYLVVPFQSPEDQTYFLVERTPGSKSGMGMGGTVLHPGGTAGSIVRFPINRGWNGGGQHPLIMMNKPDGKVMATVMLEGTGQNLRLAGGQEWAVVTGPVEKWISKPDASGNSMEMPDYASQAIDAVFAGDTAFARTPLFYKQPSMDNLKNDELRLVFGQALTEMAGPWALPSIRDAAAKRRPDLFGASGADDARMMDAWVDARAAKPEDRAFVRQGLENDRKAVTGIIEKERMDLAKRLVDAVVYLFVDIAAERGGFVNTAARKEIPSEWPVRSMVDRVFEKGLHLFLRMTGDFSQRDEVAAQKAGQPTISETLRQRILDLLSSQDAAAVKLKERLGVSNLVASLSDGGASLLEKVRVAFTEPGDYVAAATVALDGVVSTVAQGKTELPPGVVSVATVVMAGQKELSTSWWIAPANDPKFVQALLIANPNDNLTAPGSSVLGGDSTGRGTATSSLEQYLNDSLSQLIFGNYSGKVTALGTGSQMVTGVLGVDLPADIRDIIFDVTHWQWTWGHVGQTTLDAIGLLPVVGVLKYGDEVHVLLKTGRNEVAVVAGAIDMERKLARTNLSIIGVHQIPNPNKLNQLFQIIDGEIAHVADKHIGKSVDWLKLRLVKDITDEVSSFKDYATARNVIIPAIGQRFAPIDAWAKQVPAGKKAELVLEVPVTADAGVIVRAVWERGTIVRYEQIVPKTAVIKLLSDGAGGWSLNTAFLKP